MTGEETVAVSQVRAGGRHCDKPRIRRERKPLPPIVVPIVMTMFAVLWLAGMIVLIWLNPCPHTCRTCVKRRPASAPFRPWWRPYRFGFTPDRLMSGTHEAGVWKGAHHGQVRLLHTFRRTGLSDISTARQVVRHGQTRRRFRG